MQRLLVVVGMVLGVALAHAKPRPARTPAQEVEQLVRANLAGLANNADDGQLGFASNALISLDGIEWSLESPEMPLNVYARGMEERSTLSFKLGKPQVMVDDALGAAWFQLPYDETLVSESEEEGTQTSRSKKRLSGLAVRDAKGWKIAAMMYADVVPDAKLLASASKSPMPTGAPSVSGHRGTAQLVADWVAKGLSSHAPTSGALASGTAPTEFQSGAGALKLAKAWDKLGLVASRLEARLYAGDKVAAVRADVKMPRKKGGGVVSMNVLAVLVRDGDAWTWRSIQFAP